MRVNRQIPIVVLLVLAAGTAAAEEIVYFTNGTTMAVESHNVQGEMIYVNFGADSKMAFPMRMVERIEDAGTGAVIDATAPQANRAVASKPDPHASYPQTGSRPARYSDKDRRALLEDPASRGLDTDDRTGRAVHRPYAAGSHAGKRRVGVTASRGIINQGSPDSPDEGGLKGSTRMGNRHVIGGRTPGIEKAKIPIGSPTFLRRSDAPSGDKKSGNKSD